jgi:prefoldin subunit 5
MTKSSNTQNFMEKRLEELRIELAKGQRQLEFLDNQRRDVRDTMLRITGAIRVLEELLSPEGQESPERPLESATA